MSFPVTFPTNIIFAQTGFNNFLYAIKPIFNMKKIVTSTLALLCILSIICPSNIYGQVPLNTFIGADHLAADSDPICDFPIFPDVAPDLEGPYEGDFVHDFKLYTLEGDSMQLSGALNDRKPVLLIGCNYTCFVFRGKIDLINNLQATYGDQIKIYLVYTVEAHPVIDVSPYFGVEAVGDQNYADGILYRQPTTYGERKAIVSDMLAAEEINVPVLIDNPCNVWWLNFGTAPNCAFLIDPDGYIFDSQNWLNKEPENIYASIDSMLGVVGSGAFDPQGSFTAVDEGLDIYYGTAGNVISSHITLSNTSDDDVLIDFLRTANDIPATWLSYICTDLCFSPDADSTSVYLMPGQTEEVRVDFYTDDLPNDGTVDVTFRNRTDFTNTYSYSFKAQSVDETAVENIGAEQEIKIYPNPGHNNDAIQIIYNVRNTSADWQILNAEGQIVETGLFSTGNNHEINIEKVAAGIYFLRITDHNKNIISSIAID